MRRTRRRRSAHRQARLSSSIKSMCGSALERFAKEALRSGISAIEFAHIAKRAYLQAALATTAAPGKRVNVSRISAMTGLARKEISAVLRDQSGASNARLIRIHNEPPTLRVLRGWAEDRRFCDKRGIPKRLPIGNGSHSFTALVKAYAGDTTPVAVMKELQRLGAAVVSGSAIRLISARSARARAEQERFLKFSYFVRDFSTAVSDELERPEVFAFGFEELPVLSPEEAAVFRRTFGARAKALLDGVTEWDRARAKSRASRVPRNDQLRIGIGYYIVEGRGNDQDREIGRVLRR